MAMHGSLLKLSNKTEVLSGLPRNLRAGSIPLPSAPDIAATPAPAISVNSQF
jgi:hypothetical protein